MFGKNPALIDEVQKFFSKYQMNLTMGSKDKESTKVSIRNTNCK